MRSYAVRKNWKAGTLSHLLKPEITVIPALSRDLEGTELRLEDRNDGWIWILMVYD